MKVCSVCGSTLEGDGTMNRQQYTHPPDTVAACLNGEWKPITPQQLADELAALRECVRNADEMRFVPSGTFNEVIAAYDAARAKVVLP